MQVLLTGGAGYIGTHTAVELLNAGHNVIIADNFCNSSPIAVKRVEQITGKSIKLYTCDVTDCVAVERIFAQNEIDAVIHFAGYKAVGESVDKPVMYYRNNIDSILTVLEAMTRHNCRQVVFSSSATVYGDPNEVPITEISPKSAGASAYARSKSIIEDILFDTARANSELCVTILRYFNPVGAHESGMIGEDPKGIPNNLMPVLCRVASGRLDQVTIFGDDYPTPDGTCVRDYIHIVDLAQGHVAALKKTVAGVHVYNLGTGIGYSVNDIINAFERENGITLNKTVGSRRSGDVPSYYGSPKKAQDELGWWAYHSLDDMVRDSWNWQKNNPDGYKEQSQ